MGPAVRCHPYHVSNREAGSAKLTDINGRQPPSTINGSGWPPLGCSGWCGTLQSAKSSIAVLCRLNVRSAHAQWPLRSPTSTAGCPVNGDHCESRLPGGRSPWSNWLGPKLLHTLKNSKWKCEIPTEIRRLGIANGRSPVMAISTNSMRNHNQRY